MKITKYLAVIGISLILSDCNDSQNDKKAKNEFDKNSSGQVSDSAEVRKLGVKGEDTREMISPLPEAISLKKFCPNIAEQNYGTCYSYASAYAARTILFNVSINDSVTPNNNVFSPGFVQRMVFGTSKFKCRNKGTDTHYACRLMSEKGCLKLKDYPNDCSDQTLTKELFTEALKYRIKSVGLFEACCENSYKVQQIKSSLSMQRPVIICINNSDSFYRSAGNSEIWEPSPSDKKERDCYKSNHALCVIGYDDEKYGGAFEIMNSYGTDWKGDGFVWVRYNDFADFAAYAIEISNP